MTLATVPNEHFQDSEEIPDVQFNLPEDVITNDFPLFRPPEMENTGYKEIEDYVDYDAYNMIGARAKKLPNGDKVCFATELNRRSGIHGRRSKVWSVGMSFGPFILSFLQNIQRISMISLRCSIITMMSGMSNLRRVYSLNIEIFRVFDR